MKSSHPLRRRRQPPVFSCYLSVRWVRKEGAVCIATSYTQAAQLLYPQKKQGRASRVCFPVANTSMGSPKGDPWHCQFCSDILEGRKKVFLALRERRDRCWSEPYHMVVGKAGHDVEQVGGKKKKKKDSTSSLSLPPLSAAVQLCSVS